MYLRNCEICGFTRQSDQFSITLEMCNLSTENKSTVFGLNLELVAKILYHILHSD